MGPSLPHVQGACNTWDAARDMKPVLVGCCKQATMSPAVQNMHHTSEYQLMVSEDYCSVCCVSCWHHCRHNGVCRSVRLLGLLWQAIVYKNAQPNLVKCAFSNALWMSSGALSVVTFFQKPVRTLLKPSCAKGFLAQREGTRDSTRLQSKPGWRMHNLLL